MALDHVNGCQMWKAPRQHLCLSRSSPPAILLAGASKRYLWQFPDPVEMEIRGPWTKGHIRLVSVGLVTEMGTTLRHSHISSQCNAEMSKITS